MLTFNVKLLLNFHYESEPVALREINWLSVIRCIAFQKQGENDL